jgi:hypothetical protein
MAKLGAYYGLCPLIDHRSLLGICPDEEKGVVLVTLGKNIAAKYKLSDQKQIFSWRTKEKFSAPVIYDKQQSKYVAVFNETFIRSWNGNEEFLDKLKKFKFSQQIQTIFTCNEQSFIVFKDGTVIPLNEGIENHKKMIASNVINVDSEYISEVMYISLDEAIYVGLVVISNKHTYLCWTKFTQVGQDKFYKIFLHREKANLRGFVFHEDKSTVNFLTLWSDGKIYSAPLKDSDLDSSNLGELFTVIESLACREYVSMITLDQNYIAMYGCNSNEEGALLIIYNVQFKVVQSKQPFKLFTSGAKVWCIEGNLLFPVGQNLAVIPFYLDAEQLAALVGSHKVVESDPDSDVSIVQKLQFVNWGWGLKSKADDIREIVQLKIEDFVTQGFSESVIFETILTNLEKAKTVEVLSEFLTYFADIPEMCLVNVLKLILNLKPQQFKQNLQCDLKNFPQNLQPLERTELLDLILTKRFNESLLLPHLHAVLNVDDVLSLLQYIYFLLSEEGHPLPSHSFVETEAKLIQWSCVFLDANYQKFLLSRDDKIKDVLVALRDLIKDELSCFDDMEFVASLLHEIKKGKSIYKTIHVVGMDYSIEEFQLY